MAVEWAPDGKVLIAARGLLARFDLDSRDEQLLDSSGLTFAFSPNGKRLALGGANRLELRSYPALEVKAIFSAPNPDEILVLAWTPDGSTLVAGTRAGHVFLWYVSDRQLWGDLALDPPSPVTRLGFSADGRRLLTAFEDGRAVLWDIEARAELRRFKLKDGASVQALSPDGERLLATRSQAGDEAAEMLLLDAQGSVRWRRAGFGMEFTRDAAAVLALVPPFRLAAAYGVSDASALQVFEPPEGVRTLFVVRQSPDGSKLLGVGEDPQGQVLIVWDFASGRILKTRR